MNLNNDIPSVTISGSGLEFTYSLQKAGIVACCPSIVRVFSLPLPNDGHGDVGSEIRQHQRSLQDGLKWAAKHLVDCHAEDKNVRPTICRKWLISRYEHPSLETDPRDQQTSPRGDVNGVSDSPKTLRVRIGEQSFGLNQIDVIASFSEWGSEPGGVFRYHPVREEGLETPYSALNWLAHRLAGDLGQETQILQKFELRVFKE